jgi:hypothetical protein
MFSCMFGGRTTTCNFDGQITLWRQALCHSRRLNIFTFTTTNKIDHSNWVASLQTVVYKKQKVTTKPVKSNLLIRMLWKPSLLTLNWSTRKLLKYMLNHCLAIQAHQGGHLKIWCNVGYKICVLPYYLGTFNTNCIIFRVGNLWETIVCLNSSILGLKTSILGTSKVSKLYCDGPIKEAHCNKKF